MQKNRDILRIVILLSSYFINFFRYEYIEISMI